MTTAAPPHDLRDALDVALMDLPARYRDVLLPHVQGATPAQIAQALRLRAGTVAVRLSRARSLLRARLERLGVPVGADVLLGWAVDTATRAHALAAAPTLAATGRALASGSWPLLRQSVAQALAEVRPWLDGIRQAILGALTTAVAVLAAIICAVSHVAAATEAPTPAPRPVAAAADDRAWIAAAAAGWTGGELLRPDVAFVRGMSISAGLLPQATVDQLPAVRAGRSLLPVTGSFAAPLDEASAMPPSVDSPALRRLILGDGWEGAQADAGAQLLVLSPWMHADERCTGFCVGRDTHTITCILDAWTQDIPRRSSVLVRRATLIDLGPLPAGTYAVRILERTFHRGAGALAYDPWSFAAGTLSLVVDPPGAHHARAVTLPHLDAVRAADVGGAVLTRRGRLAPRCLRLRLAAEDPHLPPAGAFIGIRRLPFAKYLAHQPTTDADLPQDEGEGERYVVLLGPAIGGNDALTLSDAFWGGTPATPMLTLRVQLWEGAASPTRQRALFLLALDPAAPPTPEMMVDWSLERRDDHGDGFVCPIECGGPAVRWADGWQQLVGLQALALQPPIPHAVH